MKYRTVAVTTAATLAATALLTGCGSSDDTGDEQAASGPASLTYWAWAPGLDKVADIWNKGPGKEAGITVTVKKQASGDDLVTKIITAAKANKAPDLVQAEYQTLPTLVSNDVLADISEEAGDAKSQFADGIWQQTTLGSDALYALPQDSGPLMFYYRQDLFKQYGLTVPTTWEEFAETARALKKKAPDKDLTTFSSNDSGLFAGLSQQAGAKWWTTGDDKWKVAIDDPATQKVADFWGGLVKEGAIDNQPMYTPAWNKALNTGKQVAWVSAVWAPGTLTTAAPETKGKWAMAPLPQWTAGENVTGSWGGSSTAVTNDSKNKKAAATFAKWLNTDPAALAALVKEGGIYPAATAAQTGGALSQAPDYFSNQPDFYTEAAKIAQGTAPASWGPNVNVAYTAFKDNFAQAAKNKSDFGTALTAMQDATVSDLKKQGFGVSE
ncbi:MULTISPECIES: extracellular solute-binding protein [Streptomyces]|uniref:Multiple sugar transport system substrate-binding protein n=1 Tax=Streptomyces clavifer TaxID=68188 RepID=A0ABS4VDT3_9ACTN|nr:MULTISPECIES: extracellular solute-binding protein [Streptomyces]KQX79654.1 sugar ABC transporter substrate-binding protein [Streptomyces sp. Root1319]KQZ20831.1 sugar ABC transporter substrate-binding protein [Streptomyces sp. Root55]MBP2362085.1 multiple sugar transport system substrate-binding protein [Streptomyces clavifer]MDX2746559.1 extracellular solute-binding protein [Streptomyces sp. NRRL_B-2557]MDX3064131.1 extracellular solute-binding protein [Streptomyces sp. ND04-05B]